MPSQKAADAADQPPTGVRETKRARSILDLATIAIVVVVGAFTVRWVWSDFTFWGDNAESFWPLWHVWGTAIRAGEIFLFQPDGWAGANVVGEAAYELFNPVTALFAVFISLFDDIALAGFFVVVMTLILFGWAVYALARSYGARPLAALLVGAAAPFAGFTLFYEAGNWISGVMSAMWVTHFWWSSKRFIDRKSGPLVPFLFGALAATVGSPYAAIGIVVTLIALGGEVLLRKDARRFWQLVATGAAVGVVVVLTYVPLLFALQSTSRAGQSDFAYNLNYLSPSLSDLAAASAPTYLPRMDAWYSTNDLVPSTYLAWFIVPLLPWLRYGALRAWRSLTGIYVATAIYMLMLLGPQQLWLFRWPIRFVEYAYVGVFVLFAVLLSSGLATQRHRKRKIALTVVLILLGGYASWSSTPTGATHHIATALVLVAAALLALSWKFFGFRGLVASCLVATIGFAAFQAHFFAWSHQQVTSAADQYPPHKLSTIVASSENMKGRILQVAFLEAQIANETVAKGEFVFGNLREAAGQSTVTRYTGLGFTNLATPFDMDYRGSIRGGFVVERLFQPFSEEITAPLADVMGIDTLVLATNHESWLSAVPEGWQLVENEVHRLVYVRDVVLDHPVSHATPGIDVANLVDADGVVSFEINASESGNVVIDRLAWNGYTATLNGQPLVVGESSFGLLSIEVPAGSSGTVTIEHHVPGLSVTLPAAIATFLVVVLFQILTVVRGRRRTASTAQGSSS